MLMWMTNLWGIPLTNTHTRINVCKKQQQQQRIPLRQVRYISYILLFTVP